MSQTGMAVNGYIEPQSRNSRHEGRKFAKKRSHKRARRESIRFISAQQSDDYFVTPGYEDSEYEQRGDFWDRDYAESFFALEDYNDYPYDSTYEEYDGRYDDPYMWDSDDYGYYNSPPDDWRSDQVWQEEVERRLRRLPLKHHLETVRDQLMLNSQNLRPWVKNEKERINKTIVAIEKAMDLLRQVSPQMKRPSY